MGFTSALLWLAACFFLAVAGRSIFHFEKLKFIDGAFSLSFGIGTCIVFLSTWFICSVTGLYFNGTSCGAIYLISLILIFIYRYKVGYLYEDEAGEMAKDRRAEKKRFLLGFLFFVLLFLLAYYIKGYKPIIDHQTEQYMDFAFMKAMYRQQRVPFEDVWFAKEKINYYYLGQAVAVFICRLSHVLPEYGYNLMLCTIFAAMTTSVFELISSFLCSFEDMKKGIGIFGGCVSGLLCSCGGNGHYIVYGIVKRLYYKLSGKNPEYGYWFPSSTLFIGYDPETTDKAKHEFPSYTMVLGDFHAHVCNVLFTVPLMAVLIDYALCDRKEDEGFLKFVSPHILLMGLLLGLFKGVNYWDFPIYYVVCGSVILFCDLKKYGVSIKVVINVLIKGLIIFVTGLLVMLPFELNYVSPASGIHLCHTHSPLIKLIIIWFPFFISSAMILVYALRRFKKGKDQAGMLTIIAVTLCGLGLILLPEIIYVKDIYGNQYERYNTMFKLTFQAFILLAMMMGAVAALFMNEVIKEGKEKSTTFRYMISTACVLTLSVFLISYMPWSVRAWFGDIRKISYFKGISTVDFIKDDQSYDDVREAIKILNLDRRKNIHLLEEAGNSYSPENRLSVFSGASSVCGWFVHEWVWRNDPDAVKARNDEIRYFYESGNRDYCRDMTEKYDIDYIFVGSKVMEKYKVSAGGFKYLGKTVWNDKDKGYMLIKVNK